MGEQLSKLRPDRDLQCYFQEPSTVAALSGTSTSGFTVSGCWRQQFDWAVVEWNRDNVFEHPALRNLPDGDLSGVTLSYDELRTGCIPFDSNSYDSIGWSDLRIWEEHTQGSESVEVLHLIPLKDYATSASSSVSATAELELQGAVTTGDTIELAWLEDHVNYILATGDTLESAAAALVQLINGKSGCVISAAATGAKITLTYNGAPGSNGNRVGVYGGVHGAGTETWSPEWTMFSGGVSPQEWHVSLDFGNLVDKDKVQVTTTNVRKLRWTWAADIQPGSFQRSEFSVGVTNWQVGGRNLLYSVAGPGSRRIEDDASEITWTGTWTEDRGNYSGGSSRYSTTQGDHLQATYSAAFVHTLYLGTRYLDGVAKSIQATVQVDGGAAVTLDLARSGEDVLIRQSLGQVAAGPHTVVVTNSGVTGQRLYFDFLEIALPVTDLPRFSPSPGTTLATDWDTNHSLALAPERTAWLIDKLGFQGRANHYAGAMWFYELCSPGNIYASATVQFAGTPRFADTTQITVGQTTIQHVNLTTDTPASIAKCFELLIAAGLSAVWAHADGATLTIVSRSMGTAGNSVGFSATNSSANLTATASGSTLSGGEGPTADRDSAWRTDLNAMPRLNRAVRDWSQSYFRALKGYGIDVVSAFSMELRHGDDSLATGIAQRYPNGPVWVNTPALQTNFSPASTAFWQQAYLDMANILASAGVIPYLQFGEAQWWYFADGGPGMPFYDDYTKSTFQAAYGTPLGLISDQNTDPSAFPRECAFLPGLVGQFTSGIANFVRQTHADARFEVLYPPDVNDTPLNRLINLPKTYWTPANLTCLKTENFTYTGDRDLSKAGASINLPATLGFPPSQTSHLVGVSDNTTPWEKERQMAFAAGVESVVLFALDQVCLIGYDLPLASDTGRSGFMG
ncbi:MAG TPA: hypothetical protein VKU19_25700 [Bryobacteraceae bacterium]|nr:hypothetical protein [Bryobacteraceae bacterium]